MDEIKELPAFEASIHSILVRTGHRRFVTLVHKTFVAVLYYNIEHLGDYDRDEYVEGLEQYRAVLEANGYRVILQDSPRSKPWLMVATL